MVELDLLIAQTGVRDGVHKLEPDDAVGLGELVRSHLGFESNL